MTPAYAYVRFESDKVFHICHLKDFKNLTCKDKDDYQKDKVYKVLWTDGNYYEAQIVFLAGE